MPSRKADLPFKNAKLGICRWCGESTDNKRTRWHEHCISEYKLQSHPTYAKPIILMISGGLCSACGLDIASEWAKWQRAKRHFESVQTRRFNTFFRDHGDSCLERTRKTGGGRNCKTCEIFWDGHDQQRLDWEAKHGAKPNGMVKPWELDHIKPIWAGGTLTRENLQILCVACHKDKTAKEASERALERQNNG